MPPHDPVRLSKFLSLVLRHDPAAAGVSLDDQGWCEVDSLLAGLKRKGFAVTSADIEHLVATSDKKRYALSPDGRRIRANQGHSIEVDLQLQPRTPPTRLYHGTIAAVLDAIRREGLKKMARQHVHLSADIDTASRVGQRRGRPVILTIRATDMHAAGTAFYVSDNGVWLVDAVPAQYLELPDVPATPAERSSADTKTRPSAG